jgi:hypothetical protein
MSKATYPLKLPASIKTEGARLATEDGVSPNQWIATAVAQKIGAVETAAEFFKRRAGGAQPGDLKAFLDSVSGRARGAPRQSSGAPSRQTAATYCQSVMSLTVLIARRTTGHHPGTSA